MEQHDANIRSIDQAPHTPDIGKEDNQEDEDTGIVSGYWVPQMVFPRGPPRCLPWYRCCGLDCICVLCSRLCGPTLDTSGGCFELRLHHGTPITARYSSGVLVDVGGANHCRGVGMC